MARSSQNAFLLPLLLLVVLGGAAIAISLNMKKEATEAAAAPAAPQATPFDDLPEETPPERGGAPERAVRAGTGMPDLSDNPLALDEGWQTAMETGRKAEELYGRAIDAFDASEHGQFRELGKEARQLFDSALVDSADYAAAMEAEHGATDADVRALARARLFWEDRRAFLKKMIN